MLMNNYQHQYQYMDNAELYAKIQLGVSPPPPIDEVDLTSLSHQPVPRMDQGEWKALQIIAQSNQLDANKKDHIPMPQMNAVKSAPLSRSLPSALNHLNDGRAFSRTPRAHNNNIQSPPRNYQFKAAVQVQQPTIVKKPPTAPVTPPPPDMVGDILDTVNKAGNVLKLNNNVQSEREVVSVTPNSSHHTHNASGVHNNSASNHSTASNQTNTTVISASHSAHTSPNQNNNKTNAAAALNVNANANANANAMNKNQNPNQSSVVIINNPEHIPGNVVIPMDQNNYNHLLQQVYGAHPNSFNPAMPDPYTSNPNVYSNQQSPGVIQGQPFAEFFNPYDQSYIQATTPYYPPQTTNAYYDGIGDIYGAHSHASYPPMNVNMNNMNNMNMTGYDPYPARSGVHYSNNKTRPITTISIPNGHHNQHLQYNDMNLESLKVDWLVRANGSVISPNSDPTRLGIGNVCSVGDEELDAFTAGDDAVFGNEVVTLIVVNWQTSIPYATVRMHHNNQIQHVPLLDLRRIAPLHGKNNRMQKKKNDNNRSNNRFRLTMNNKFGHNNTQQHAPQIQQEVVIHQNPNAVMDNATMDGSRNAKLSDETLMKLPHLRRHREYIKTIDVNMGPKDYNSYRVSVNSNSNNNDDKEGHSNNENVERRSRKMGNHRSNNLQYDQGNLNGGNHYGNKGNLNASNNLRRNKKMTTEKGDLFKTELCENWVKKGHCTYGKKCHFAHGREDIRTRWRIENYKTQPCCDPARADSRLCLFGKRCNYAHPGEPLRRAHHCLYLDEEYEEAITKDYGTSTPYPFGIYI